MIAMDTENMMDYHGRLRYFSPQEILRLHGFHSNFQFPEMKIKLKQQFKLLGNSLNVIVIKYLLSILIS